MASKKKNKKVRINQFNFNEVAKLVYENNKVANIPKDPYEGIRYVKKRMLEVASNVVKEDLSYSGTMGFYACKEDQYGDGSIFIEFYYHPICNDLNDFEYLDFDPITLELTLDLGMN